MSNIPISENGGSILALLESLPPSKELLNFYRSKISRFVDEEKKLLEQLENSKYYFRKLRNLEVELKDKIQNNSQLTRNVRDLSSALNQERKLVIKLYGENEALKNTKLENEKKIQVLFRLTGKKNEDVIKILDEEVVSNKQADESKNMSRSKKALCLEVQVLEKQLIDQEKCHVSQISKCQFESCSQEKEKADLIEHYERRLEEISEHVNILEEDRCASIKSLTSLKTELRNSEKQWAEDFERYSRKIQFLEHFGPRTGLSGVFSHQRTLDRNSEDHKNQKALQKLRTSLAESRSLGDEYRKQIISLEKELNGLLSTQTKTQNHFEKQNKSMTERLHIAESRYEALDQRRRQEMIGYESDIKLLMDKLKNVERHLVSAALSQNKEHKYLRTIRSQGEEIEELKRDLKRNPEWRN